MKSLIKVFNNITCKSACFLIKVYQFCISTLLSSLFGSCCRFYPSCSQYGYQAFKKYSFLKAFKLTIKRLSKCHPGGSSGYDPVP